MEQKRKVEGGGGRVGVTRKVIAHGGCLLVARSLVVDVVSIPYLYRRAKWSSPLPLGETENAVGEY